MSQILSVQLDLSLQELHAALTERGVKVQHRPGRKLLLPVSSECIAEPVDLLCEAGVADALEAWGIREHEGEVLLVCGQFDQRVLQEGLIDPIRQSLALARVQHALHELDQETESESQRAQILVRTDSNSD